MAKKRNLTKYLKRPFGFTLVELIVVITILAILATVWFLTLSWYLSSARDSSRMTEIGQISRSVELFAVQNGKYPVPVASESVPLVAFTGGASGGSLVTQGAATSVNVRDLGGGFGKKKSTGPFVYSILGDGISYQIAAELEGSVSAEFPSVPRAYAASTVAYVEGSYRPDPSLPSLIVSSGSTNAAGLFSPDACFVTNGGMNLFSTNSGCVPKKSLVMKALDPGLAGYWDMETSCVSGSCGAGNDWKLADLSGNGNVWTMSGTVLVNGLAGKARSFTGGAAVNQVEIPNSATIDIGWTGSVASFEAIFRVNSLSSDWQNVFFKGAIPDACATSCSSRQYGLWINGSWSVHMVSTSLDRTSSGQTVGNSPKWWIVVWKDYLVTAVVDSTGWKIKTYVNGVLQNETPYSKAGIRNSTGSLMFWASHNSYAMDGTLDEIKIFNRILDSKEIQQHARALGY